MMQSKLISTCENQRIGSIQNADQLLSFRMFSEWKTEVVSFHLNTYFASKDCYTIIWLESLIYLLKIIWLVHCAFFPSNSTPDSFSTWFHPKYTITYKPQKWHKENPFNSSIQCVQCSALNINFLFLFLYQFMDSSNLVIINFNLTSSRKSFPFSCKISPM